ncbi:MFS transporter [Ruania alkalisoli]|uniref:MFS transporter n=1 Tax=Ruania alkalisoli TaxID=2779775 RepID=A0A7M1SPG1_9MICO|nr:MFS transporter [Ruania alkalisoli]QOR69449.1 MFS transporter [Ruania alkalisoli]
MSPLSSYRNLFSLTGALYVAVAFLARLPLAMSQIGALLLVSAVTGSYGAGGAAAGATAVVNAVASPFAGALTDRVGQRRVLLVQSVVGAAGLLWLVLAAAAYTPGEAWWPLVLIAGASGAFLPQVGTMARVRWRPIARRSGGAEQRLVDAAFSYEGAADEASFVLGPALVGVVAAVLNPSAALIAAGVLLGVFGLWFALHPTATVVPKPDRTVPAVRIPPVLFVLVFAQLTIGMIFGSVQAGASVLATEAGEPGLTGLLHALLGIGSVTAGLAVVAVPEAFRYENRLRLFTVALAVLSLPLLLVTSLGVLVPVLIVLGLAVAPSMITTFTLAERISPPSRLGAAMTLLAAATGLGYAVGSSAAGRIADWGGYTPAFAVTITGASLAALISLFGARALRRAQTAPRTVPEQVV